MTKSTADNKPQESKEVAVSHAASQAPALILDEGQIQTLKDQLLNDGIELKDSELGLIMHQVKRTGLDPIARQLYVTSSSVKKKDGSWGRKLNIQATIDGFRLIADRSGKYEGQLGPEWCGADGVWRDVWIDDAPPLAARVGIIRSDFKSPLWGVATWKSYAQYTKSRENPQLQHNWSKMPDLMLAKCAEALALRKGFPQELSGLYTNDELPDKPEPIEAEVVAPAPATATKDEFAALYGVLKHAGVTTREDAEKAIKHITLTDNITTLPSQTVLDAIEFIGSASDTIFKDSMAGAGVTLGTVDPVTTVQAKSGDTVITDMDDQDPSFDDIPF